MKISILVFDNCTAISSLGSYDLLVKANRWAADHGVVSPGEDLFELELVGVNGKRAMEVGGISINVPKTIDEIDETDLVIIPGIDENIEKALEDNYSAVPWIRKMYDRGASLASMCTGCFVLAETGLLNGKSATTHWIAENEFKERYPEVDLLIQNIIVDEGRICSCGGATSFMNLILYLVEKYGGSPLARFSSKVFLLDMKKENQKSYAIFSVQKQHNDETILNMQKYIESRYGEKLEIEALARKANSSRRNFIRRFKSATGNTPIEYIQRVRVEAAKKELEKGWKSISEIISEVGYEDASSFRKIFSRHTGLTMSRYRERYHLYKD